MAKIGKQRWRLHTWQYLFVCLVAVTLAIGTIYLSKSAFAAPGVTYIVTNTGDNGGANPAVGAGTGTLRQAIVDANANAATSADPNKITFNIAGAGVQTINLSAILPGITTPTIVDGTTQPGASCGTLVPNDANGAITNTGRSAHTLLVEINAASVPISTPTATMNTVSTASGSTIKGLVIYGVAQANYSQLTVNSPNTTVTCNYLGVKADGATAPVKTPVTVGLTATSTASGLTVTNNLMSGTTQNYLNTSTNTGGVIANNLFGTDSTGMGSAQNAGNVTASNGISLTSITNYDVKNNVFANATVRLVTISTATTSQIRGNYVGIGIDGKTTSGFTASTAGVIGNYGKGLTIGGPNASDRNYVGGVNSTGLGINNVSTVGLVTYQNNAIGLGADGVTATPNNGAGISSANTTGTTIKDNIIVNNGATGITINGDKDAVVQGNYVGVTPGGTPMKNKSAGIAANGATTNLLIGGTTAGQGNYISGNNTAVSDAGININSIAGVNGVTIQGNYIGVKPDGVTAAPNGYGIQIAGASNGPINITIGGNTAAARNIISGNTTSGFNITALTTSTSNYVIAGNYIGLDKNGNTITGASGRGITGTNLNGVQIGGDSTAGYGNVISGNPGDAINISGSGGTGQNLKILGNLIGVKPDGVTAAGNGGYGIYAYATTYTGAAQIGGAGAGDGNVIVNGTGSYGVMILNASAAANPIVVKGNYLGVLKNGTAAGSSSGGIYINNSNGVQVGGTTAGEGNYISGNSTVATTPGLRIDTSSNITVQGNTIGLAPDGITKLGNGYGILFGGTSLSNITIGGNSAGARNIISGNVTHGISLTSTTTSSSNVAIQGNYIGLDKNGDVVAGATGNGMYLTNPNGLLIGGASAGQGNIISGNPGVGLAIVMSAATGNNVQIYGNTIGLKPDKETAAGNGNYGINFTASSPASLSGVIAIGGASAGQGNIISGNTKSGVYLYNASDTGFPIAVKGNRIGLSASGVARGNTQNGISIQAMTNATIGGIGAGEANLISGNGTNGIEVLSTSSKISIRGNSIYQNGKNGIDLQGSINTPDANDLPSALDADTGGNGLQNFPQRTTLTKCDASTEQATYLWSAANTTYTVDFYANPSGRDTTGYGEGEQYVSSTTVTTSAAGYASITPPAGVTNLSMTATDPNGNTSEFSNERPVSISGCTVTAKSTSDTTPSLAGTTTLTGFAAGATPTTAALTINGQNVSASITSPNWTLADNTLTVLPAGSYNVGVSVTDPVSKLSTSYSAANALTIDTTSPTVTVDQSSGQADPTNVDSASFDIVFSEDVSTLTVADITLSGTTGTVTTLTKVDNKTYKATVTGMTSGDTATITIAAAKVTDSASNTNAASTSTDNHVTYDSTAPTVTINQAAGQADPTNVNSASFNIVFSEPVTTLSTSGISLSGTSGTLTTLTKVDASHYTAIVTGMANGDTVTATVNASAVKDLAGNNSIASTSTDNQATYDASRSDVAITRKAGQAAYTQTNSAWFTVTLTKPAAAGTFTSSDINPGTTTGTITTLSQIDSLHYEFEITGMTSGDSATPSIAAGAFTDTIGNTNYASTGDANNWVMYDVTAPNAFAANLDVTSSGHDMDHPLVSWSTTDGQSGIDHYTMSVDGGSFSTVTSPQSVTLTPAASHTIVVRAYDKAGNMREKTVVYPPIENITAPTTLSNVAITDTTIKVTGPTGMIITNVTISGAGSSGFTCTPTPSSSTTVPISCSGGQITATGTLTVSATTDAGVTTQNTQDYTIDTIKPTVTINQAATQNDPTNVDSAKFTVVFSKAINAASFTASDITLSGTSGTITGLTQVDSRTWTITVTGMTDGDTVTATLPASKVTDLAGNNNTASTSTDNKVTYDTAKPAVMINQAAGQADPTNNATMNFTATFSEPVSGLSTSGIQISGSLTAHVSAITAVSGSIYTVTVIGATDGDTVKATILAGAATDAAGNANTASTSTDNQITYDGTPPIVTINQAAGQADPTNINSAKFDIVFSEDVSTLTASGIALTGSTGTVTALTKVDARHYTATVTGMTDGDVATAAVKTSVVSDASGNSNTASTSTDNQVTYDTTQPTVTVNQVAGQADPTNQDYATFRIVFSEPVQASSFTYDDLTITGTTGSVASLTQIDSTTWDVVISGMTNGDIATVSLLASKVTDLAGNANTASTSTDNQVTYDTTQPTVTVNQAAGQADPTNSNSAQFTIVFSKPVTVLDTSKLQLSGSTSAIISNVAAVSSTTYTVTISSMTNGDTVSLAAAADAATDIAGNTSQASTSTDNSVAYDTTAPNATVHTLVTNDSTPVVAGTISDPSATVIVTINGIDYPATNNGDGTWTLSDNTISPALTDGVYDVTTKTADTAGNESTSTAASSLTIDTAAPTGTINEVAPSITNSPALDGTVSDPSATVTVNIDGHTYTATNHGDGTWSLPAGTIAPALTPGTHTATVTFSDAAGNQTTQSTDLTIQRPDADPPTVNPVDWVGGTPVITGTYDATNSQSLTVTVNGVTYTLGSSPELTASGSNWTLNLSNLSTPLPAGSYDVKVQVTTRSAGTLGDTTATELTVLPITIPAVITNPGAGLARTGMTVWMVVAGGVGLLATSTTMLWMRLQALRQNQR